MPTAPRVVAAMAFVVCLTVPLPATAAPNWSAWSEPTWLGPQVNSAAQDVLPALSKDGLTLFFTSDRAGGYGSFDVWVSVRNEVDEPWGMPVNLGPAVNTASFDAGTRLSRDGHWLFFHRIDPAGSGGLDLMASYREHVHDPFGWQTAVNLGPVVNSPAQEAGPSFFEGDEDGPAELYFGSNRPGLGSFDVYVSTLDENGWSAPRRVDELSSASFDQSPDVRFDGRELLLYSGRPGGAGNADIWAATRPTTADTWESPVPVAELNGPWNDFMPTLSADASTVVFASDRPGGLGLFDIYVAVRARTNRER